MKESCPTSSLMSTEKIDGSLGILYWVGDEAKIATRGSFTSRQAEKVDRDTVKKIFGVELGQEIYVFI